ncbi:unnamed protein product [Leuciscus chuanchicus]
MLTTWISSPLHLLLQHCYREADSYRSFGSFGYLTVADTVDLSIPVSSAHHPRSPSFVHRGFHSVFYVAPATSIEAPVERLFTPGSTTTFRPSGPTLVLSLPAYVITTNSTQQYKDALNSARSSHYSSVIQSGSNSPKTLFSTINKLLKPMDTISNSFTTSKCDLFLSFFKTKIDNIHNQLAHSTPYPTPGPPPPSPPSHFLSSFTPITEAEVSTIISSMKPSTSPLHPMPTFLTKTIRTKRRTWGDRAFSAAAPTLWNALPDHIKQSSTLTSFRQALKTHLFELAFSC